LLVIVVSVQKFYQTEIFPGLSVPNFLMWLLTTPIQARKMEGGAGREGKKANLITSLFWVKNFTLMDIKH
jgi:hypothetical protein